MKVAITKKKAISSETQVLKNFSSVFPKAIPIKLRKMNPLDIFGVVSAFLQ